MGGLGFTINDETRTVTRKAKLEAGKVEIN